MSGNAEASVDEEMGRSCKVSYFPRSEGGGKIHEKENNHEEMDLSPEFLKATGISAVAAGLTACGGSSSSTSSSTASGSAAASGEMPKVVMYYPLSSVQPDQER